MEPPGRQHGLVRGKSNQMSGHFRVWHVADLGQCLTLVRNAPDNGHATEAAKPTLLTLAV